MKKVNGDQACDQCGADVGPFHADHHQSGEYCPACFKSRTDYEDGGRYAAVAAIQKLVGLALDEGAERGDILNAVHEEMESRTVMAVERARTTRSAA